jgi:hypothetical protein
MTTNKETRSDIRSDITRDDVRVIRVIAGHYRIEDKATGQWIGTVLANKGVVLSQWTWTVVAGADIEDRYVPGSFHPRHISGTDRLKAIPGFIVQFARGYR